MTKKKNSVTPPGPSAAFISHIEYLWDLLHGLSTSLPLDPPDSTYHFELDPEDIDECGTFRAFKHCMEISFKTWQEHDSVIHFKEHGRKIEELIELMKGTVTVMTEAEHDVFCNCWINQLISTATTDGACIQPQTGTVGVWKCTTQAAKGELSNEKASQDRSGLGKRNEGGWEGGASEGRGGGGAGTKSAPFLNFQ